MNELINEIKLQIIDALNLEGMTPEEIETDAPLFGEGLGLDSIDVLELIVLLEKNYGIKLTSPQEGKKVFASVRTLAEYVKENRTK
ncbi:MAG: acyl carrier protein [Bacteroidales bacterium]|nr:acyl carrier protein [Bacteroidales bacterium]